MRLDPYSQFHSREYRTGNTLLAAMKLVFKSLFSPVDCNLNTQVFALDLIDILF
jgi:hypothetical protein